MPSVLGKGFKKNTLLVIVVFLVEDVDKWGRINYEIMVPPTCLNLCIHDCREKQWQMTLLIYLDRLC